ncbi:hypothetical protein SAMD00019534_057160, partial [Acytostelium subglobosum LB1]|uniref:hypothetical protein n=1 Tax=Acytostelium subglobosum LB1 TaxID=1410327 RepID=UPI0006451D26
MITVKANHYLSQKRAAIKWIEVVLDIKINSGASDFISTLYDGVLLCRVMQTISPGLMPRISVPDPNTPRTIIQFKNSENISFFLQACQDMGVPRHKRFALADLCAAHPTYTNIRRIIDTLEAICKLANADPQYEFDVPWPIVDAKDEKFTESELVEAEGLLAQFTIRETKRQEVIKKSQARSVPGSDFSVSATKNQLFQHVADQKKMYPDNSPKRYSLLLKDMIAHTWESHPDYKSLKEAFDSMNTVAEKMNEAKQQAENRLKLAEIQEKLAGGSESFVKASRRFVKEGEFMEVGGGTKAKKTPLILYLFNDILAVTKPSKSSGSFFGKQKTIRLQFENSYKLTNLKLRQLEDTSSYSNAIKISTNSDNAIVICAADSDTLEDWIAAIKAEKAEAEKTQKDQDERITSSVSEKVADTKQKLEQQFVSRTSGQYAPIDPDAQSPPLDSDNSSSTGSNVDKTGSPSTPGKMSLREKRMKLVQESRSNRSSVSSS